MNDQFSMKSAHLAVVENHLERFLEMNSPSIYWKDKKGIYLGVNDTFIKVSGMHSHDEVIGKSDRDLLWHEQAEIMMKNDQNVIYNNTTKTYIEAAKSPLNRIIQYLSRKTPLYSRSGKILGTIGLSFEFNHTTTKDILSKRQADCLFYLVRGMTIKQIAFRLNLSPKTVEHYIEAIKIKLNCSTRSDLVIKALEMGFGI